MSNFTIDLACGACKSDLEFVSGSKDTKFEGRYFFDCSKPSCQAKWILSLKIGRIDREYGNCGTYSGYKDHVHAGQNPCDKCKEASIKYHAERHRKMGPRKKGSSEAQA